jgi:hypothetical protein
LFSSETLELLLADGECAAAFEESLKGLLAQDGAMQRVLDHCDARVPRADGIPTLIVLEDFFADEQPMREAAPGDEALGLLLALWLPAFAAKIEAECKDERYPSVCPAMSALAEKFFHIDAYQARDLGRGGDGEVGA